MTEKPVQENPGEALLDLVNELTPVLYYGAPVSRKQWAADKAAYLAALRGEVPPAETEESSN